MDPLIALFAEVLEVEPDVLNDESSPENIESWDSLAAMTLVAAIETEFDVELTTSEIMGMNTIGIVRRVLAEKGVQIAG